MHLLNEQITTQPEFFNYVPTSHIMAVIELLYPFDLHTQNTIIEHNNLLIPFLQHFTEDKPHHSSIQWIQGHSHT